MSEDVFKDGTNAERLLTDATFLKAMQEIENDACEAWKISTTKEKREELFALVTAVGKLRTKLEAMKGAKIMAERMEKSREKTFGKAKGQ